MPSKRRTYPGCLDRHGDVFRWRVSVAGKRQVFTLRTTDRKQAQKFARSKHAELSKQAEREAEGLPGQVSMSALFDQFEREALPLLSPGGRRSYEDSLKPLRTYFVDETGNPKVDRIRAAHIHDFLTWRRSHRLDGQDGNVSNRTLTKDRGVLHGIFAMAERLEYREGNPVASVKPLKSDSRTPTILSNKEYQKLIDACVDRDMLKLYVLVLGETGTRCHSEALWLRWEDVDLEDGFLQIVSGREGHRTKSGKARYTPMTMRLVQAMRQHFARYRFAAYNDTPTPWIFHHTRMRRTQPAGSRIQSFYRSFKAAAKRAKLPGELRQHDMRHRRVTTWLAEEKNPVHVKVAVGHSNLATTMAYTHLAKEHLRSLVDQEPKREELRDLA